MTKRIFRLLLWPLVVIIAIGLLSALVLLFQISFAQANPPLKQVNAGISGKEKPFSRPLAFSKPSTQVKGHQKMDFLLGRAIFKKLWVSSPASTKSSDGLGPLFNARSCLSCHPKNGRGRPVEKNKTAHSLFLQLSIKPENTDVKAQMKAGHIDHQPDPVYGSQLQTQAVQGLKREGEVTISYQPEKVTLSGGESVSLHKPVYKISNWGYGKPHPDLRFSPRLAPQMIGLGLLESIAEKDIKAIADPDDKNKDGISGKVSKVWSQLTQKIAIGRFGWKASMPTVLEQSSAALVNDIGISNSVFPYAYGDCSKAQINCQRAPNGNSKVDGNLEIRKQLNDKLAFYASSLTVPKPRILPKALLRRGKTLFETIGCASCHRPSFTIRSTGSQNGNINNKRSKPLTIWPYSDLLLHDMGKALSDDRPVHNAFGSEWRTPPLWGIGLSKAVNGNAFFLHDGRARTIKEAILWHGGEAAQARKNFMALNKLNRDRLLAFIKSR